MKSRNAKYRLIFESWTVKNSLIFGLTGILCLIFVGCGSNLRKAESAYKEGVSRMKDNLPDEAETFFTQALQYDTNFIPARLARGQVYLILKKNELAFDDYSFLIKQVDGSKTPVPSEHLASIYNGYGISCLGTEHWKEAVDAFTKASEIDQDNLKIIANRGFAYSKLENWTSALKDLNVCLEKEPQSTEFLRNRAFIYAASEEFGKALADIDNAIRLEPKNALLFEARGNLSEKAGKWEDAILDFTNALELDPLESSVLFKRGLCFKELGQMDKALSDIIGALEIEPENEGYLFEREAVEKILAAPAHSYPENLPSDDDHIDSAPF